MNAILVPTLAELAVEFERSYAVLRAADAACIASGESSDLGFDYDRACDALGDVCKQVALLPAQNVEDVRLKARALEWLNFPEAEEPAAIGERLAFQLVRAILDGVPS